MINKDNSTQYPDHFIINNTPIIDTKEIANSFNDFFFINIGPVLSTKIKNVNINHSHYLNNPNQSCMFLTPTNPNEIMTIFKTLKDSAAGMDGYNLKIMKAILDSIILPITHIINLSFLTGVVPKETARVMPLFKSDNLHVLNNYRPISILPILSKIMEKCVHKRICHFLSKNDYLYQSIWL